MVKMIVAGRFERAVFQSFIEDNNTQDEEVKVKTLEPETNVELPPQNKLC